MTIASAARRSFLKHMAGGAAVLGLGGGQIAPVATDAVGLAGASLLGRAHDADCATQHTVDSQSDMLAWARKIARMPIPDWRRQEMWRYAGAPSRIDPDIASMRSWSLTAKFAAQRKRNYEASIKDHYEGPMRNYWRRLWRDEHGAWL